MGPVLVALILFFLSLLAVEPMTKVVLNQFYFRPGVVQAAGSSQTPIAFQGVILQEKALASPDILPLYGSSEFSAESEFHPWKVFDGKPTGFVPFLVGRGGSQSLIHSLSLAAQGDTLVGKKVAVILSAQWFVPQGLKNEYLSQNFSPLQVYRILFEDSLSPKIRGQIVNRLLEYPEVLKSYPTLEKNLRQYGDHGPISWAKAPYTIANRVAGWIEMKALILRDAMETAQFLPLIKEEVITRNADTVNINWEAGANRLNWTNLRKVADQRGKELTKNNSFYVMDSYFTKYMAPELKKLKGSEIGSSLYPSPEYQDLQILMDLLNEKEAKALFIIVPMNGKWYDYISFPRETRNAYYSRVRDMIQKNGFEVADFSGHEYEPYFLQDIMHLGWKGWVYVDEALDKFYHQGN
jgi:D-alanine transfer protein